MAIHGSRMFDWRRALSAGGLAVVAALGCATSAAPPDRLSPEQLRNGPSLYETGRFGVVQPSSGGLRIDAGAIERAPVHPSPRPTGARATAKRKARAHAQRTP